MLQCSHDVLLCVLSHRDRGCLQLSVILETVEATSNGLASNFRDRSSLSLNPIRVFFFFLLSFILLVDLDTSNEKSLERTV